MTPQAVFSRPGHFGSVEWEFEGRSLHIRAQGLPIETYPIRDITSIGGDDYTIHLGHAGDTLTLSRLGVDGARLREGLLSLWPAIRADALKITGRGEPTRYGGMHSVAGEEPVPFTSLLFEDVLVIGVAGTDVQPLHLSSLAELSFSEASYSLSYRTWARTGGTFSRLGPATDEFVKALTESRARLVSESMELVATVLPMLAPTARCILAERWLPGELLPLAALEAGSPGLGAALQAGWIATEPRAAAVRTLLDWSDPHKVFVGYRRQRVANESTLWLLAGNGGTWILEDLSGATGASYQFRGDGEIPRLASALIKAAGTTGEALSPPDSLLADVRPDLVTAARDLPFLRDLRQRFVGLVDHEDPIGWSRRIRGL